MRYLNRIASLLLCIVLLLSLNVTASALAVAYEDKKGTITVEMKYDGKAVSGGTLAVYRIGDASEENGKYKFRKSDSMNDFDFDLDLDSDPDRIGDAALAENVADFVQSNNFSAYADTENIDGKAVFNNLDLGIYLVVQTKASDGYEPLMPFLVSIPMNYNGNYKFDVTAEGKTQNKQDSLPTSPADDPDNPSAPDTSGKPTDNPTGDGTGNTHGNTAGEILPQTGQLNWPVPMLTALGLLLFTLGWLLTFSGKREKQVKK